MNGYKCKLGTGHTIRAERNERGWSVSILGPNGMWKPAVHSTNPIWEDCKKWESLPEKFAIDREEWNKFRAEVEQQERESSGQGQKEADPGAKPVDPTIREKAFAIMKDGDIVRYLIFQAQRNHLGDIPAQTVMLCSLAGSNSVRGSGLQPSSTGDKGSGKTDSLKSVHHLIPKPWGMAGSLSAKSLFYLSKTGQLVPGTIFFSDDIEWGPIKPVYKRSTGSFQERTGHITVDKHLNPLVLEIPERFTWWLSSVESVDDDQVADRQHPIGTDPSLEHKRQVSTEIGARRARKELRFVVDEGIEIARDIIRQIKSHPPFQVLIPQAERSAWSIPADFRGQDRFWDIVEAFTILRFVQRETVDGWLIATAQDIQDAIELFNTQKVEHTTKLTPSEVGLLGAMMDGLEKTQAELARALEISQQVVSNRLKSIMSKTKYITCENGPMGTKLYKIASTEELKTEFWRDLTLIAFEGGLKSPSDELTTTLQPTYNPLTGIPTTITINNCNRIPVSLQPRVKNHVAERKRWWIKNNKPSIFIFKRKIQNGVVKSCNDSGRSHGVIVSGLYGGCRGVVTMAAGDFAECLSASPDPGEPPAQGLGAELADADRRRIEGERRKATPVYCAVCGADLTNRGRLEKNGEIYCLQPGCGYPAREGRA